MTDKSIPSSSLATTERGVTAARVLAVAGPPGQPATLRFDRIPFDALRTFRRSLAIAA